MKIAVACKWAPDPREATVTPRGNVDWTRANRQISEYDQVAIGFAKRLAVASGAELIGLMVVDGGANTPAAHAGMLSRGADRALVVLVEPAALSRASDTAKALAAAVTQIGDVAVLVTGEASLDLGAGLVPVLAAGELGWPALAHVADAVSDVADGKYLSLVKRVRTTSQTLRVRCPAVIAVAADAQRPSSPGMRDVLAARKKRVDVVELESLGVKVNPPSFSDEAFSPVQRRPRRGVIFDGADAATASAELVAALLECGVLPKVDPR